MAIIYTYPQISELAADDILVISDVSKSNKTRSVTVGQLLAGLATTTQVDDRVVTGASFNTNTGLLTLTRNGGDLPSVTTNLDGRYYLSNNPNSYTSNLGVVQSLTTNNSSGAATLIEGVLNIPQYPGGGGGGAGTVTNIATTAPITGGAITETGTIGITLATASADGYLSSTDWNTFNNKQSTSEKGQANGYAPLDENNKVPTVHLPDSLVGAVIYQGTWDANNNIPELPAPAAGNNGHYYIVSDAGTYSGITYAGGDWIISNGIAWEKVDNTQDVNSVFGRQGNIAALESDYAEFYDANVQSDWSVVDTSSDAFILNKPTTITQEQANEIAANTIKTSFPGFGTTEGTALEGNTVIPAAYTNADVDAHLNTTGAGNNEVLSWTGADYAWVAQSGGGGISGSGVNTQMAIFDSSSTITSTQALAVNSSSQIIMDVLRGSNSYADDTAALAGGVPYGGLYRTNSTVKINLLGNSPGPGPGEVEICSLIWTTENSSETELIAGGNIPILTTAAEMRTKYLQQQPAACYWQFDENESYRGLYYNIYARNVVKPPSGFRLPTFSDYSTLTGAGCNSDRPNQNRYGAPLPNNYNPSLLTNTDFLGDSGFNAYGYGAASVFSSTQVFWLSNTTHATFWTSGAANQTGSRISFAVTSSNYLTALSWANSDADLASIKFVKNT